jgi:hypothetical protein
MIPNENLKQIGAITGWEGLIIGTLKSMLAPTVADLDSDDWKALAGAVLPIGTYFFAIPVSGAVAVDVTLRASAGAATASIYRVLADHITEKMDPAGASAAQAFAAFVIGTQQTVSITGLRGEAIVLLKVVVAVAGFTLDQAFFSSM